LFTLLPLAAALLFAVRAHAQPVLVPPALQGEPPPAVYPEGASGAASVELELTIDAQGAISDVSVTQSAGAPFDDAALSYARALAFTPAQRDGVAIAAVIAFRVELTPPPPPPPAPPSQQAPPTAARATPEEPPPLLGSVELEVRGAPPVREPTRRELAAEEVRTIPGTNGDVLRSVETLPGVARPSPLDGILVVRGAAPNDTQVFVDGTPIPIAYHFGGINSVIPGEVLDRLDFYPGNFGAHFGRGMGGIIDVGLRAPRSDRFGGLVQLDLIDGRVLVETPLGSSTRLLLAGRRSWVDAWLGPVLSGSDVDVRGAPVYYDGQLVLEQDLGARTRARLAVFGSDDRLELLIKSPNPSDPGQGGSIASATSWIRAQLRVESQLSDHTRFTNMLSWGYTDSGARFGDAHFDFGLHEINGRSELRTQLSSWLGWTAGLDVAYQRYDVDLLLGPYPGDNTAPGPYFARPSRKIQTIAPLFRPGIYTGFELSPTAAFKIMPGVRADFNADTGDATVDPRVSARWDVVPGPSRSTLKGGVGVYHQPPQPQESVKPVGNPDIRSSRALQASLGIEQEFVPGFDASLEGFYKSLDDLVVARGDESQVIGARFENSGEGQVYGAEFMLRYRPSAGPLSGWIAYTLSRSERRDSTKDDYYIFAYDQTHILSAVANYKLGRGWTLGGRFRYVTGNPYTPYSGGVVDLDAGAYAALSNLRPYSARMGAFHQLDLRVEKRWEFELWKLTVYLELRNAYNRGNPEAIDYNYDYSRSKPVAGLPILPVLGLRGEL
jgi:TonB family protein